MEKIFLSVLNMSFTGAFVIVAVIFVRLPLKKAPKIVSYVMWTVVGFRLAFPFAIQSIFSLLPFKSAPIPQDIAMQAIPRINSGVTVIDNAVSAVLPAATPAVGANPLQIWIAIGSYIWILGIAAMLVYSVLSIVLVKHRLRSASHIEGNLYEADNLKTPFVLGLFSPKIYIPAGLSEEERRYIVLHEQTHIRRHDHIVKMFAYFVLCLHWFNPLAWIAFILMGADMEMSCDERVMKELGGEIKIDYSLSLVRVAAGHTILNGSPLAFGEGGMKERVKNVLNYKKHSRVIIIAAVALAAVVIAGFAVNRAGNRPFADLKAQEITKIIVECMPPDVSVEIDDRATIEEIKNILRTVVIYGQDDSGRGMAGQLVKYTLSMSSGKTIEVGAFGDFMFIGNECYKAKPGPSNELHNLGNQLKGNTKPPHEIAMDILKGHYPGAKEIVNLGMDTISYTNPPAPVEVFKYEVDVDGNTIVCAVAKESGMFFTYEDGKWGNTTGIDRATLSSPEILQGQSLGVDMTQLDYASDDSVIFHDYFGLFVYNLNAREIVRSVDLKPIGCAMTQGDDACEVLVSADGNTVQLHSMSSKKMYVYTVSEGTLEEKTYTKMENRFANFTDITDVVGASKVGSHSYHAVRFGKGDYGFLRTTDWTVDTLNYIRNDKEYQLFDSVSDRSGNSPVETLGAGASVGSTDKNKLLDSLYFETPKYTSEKEGFSVGIKQYKLSFG